MRRFLRVPTIYVLSKNKKNVSFFHLKITIFTAVKYCSILHGHVCVMYLKTKTHVSFAVTAKLISVFVFATWVVQYIYSLNPKFQAYVFATRNFMALFTFCDYTARFVSGLVGKPKSHTEAHMILCKLSSRNYHNILHLSYYQTIA